ncbi:hypothetical protein [Lawsonibacter sp. JLR.KK007]|jgi:hypothetical protein|uniref:hypothetical protein n=1 Tax=Lawsonibacter sp. JLR.KK007 TaxID=3114293 RepID=UPI002FF2ABEA
MELLPAIIKEIPVPVLIIIGAITILLIFSESIVKCVLGFILALTALKKGHEEIEYYDTRVNKKHNEQSIDPAKKEGQKNIQKPLNIELLKIVKSILHQKRD